MNEQTLGYFETKSALAYAASSGSSNAYCGDDQLVICTHLLGKLDYQKLIETLAIIFNKFHRLRCSFQLDANKRFVLQESVKFRDIPIAHITEKPFYYWRSIVQEKLAALFPLAHHLWEATLLSTNEQQHCLILSFHHVMTDGISSAELVHQILEGYFKPELLERRPAQTCFKPPEYYYSTPRTAEHYQALLERTAVLTAIAFEHQAPLEARAPKSILLSFALNPVQALCKQIGCTVNALLATILLCNYEEINRESIKSISLSTCVDLRRRIPGAQFPAHNFGSFLNSVTNYFSREILTSINSFADKVRYVQQSIDRYIVELSQPPIDASTNTVDEIFGISQQVNETHFQCNLDMSNLGKLTLKKNYGEGEAQLNVASYFFFVNAKLAISEFLYNFASIEDRLFGQISTVVPSHSVQTLNKFCEHFVEVLYRFVPNFMLIPDWTEASLLTNNCYTIAPLLAVARSPVFSASVAVKEQVQDSGDDNKAKISHAIV